MPHRTNQGESDERNELARFYSILSTVAKLLRSDPNLRPRTSQYNRQRTSYDRTLQQAAGRVIGDRNELTIVDLGSGTGRFLSLLADGFDSHVVGVAPSGKMRSAASSCFVFETLRASYNPSRWDHGTATTQQFTGIRPSPGMAQEFDPYHKWLSIPPEEQPPNHYRLLGLPIFESDPDVIEHAADRQMAHLRTFQSGSRSSLSQELLNEISTARLVLLDRKQKAAYDADLRQQQATPQIVGTPPLSKLPVVAASAPHSESLIPSVPALPVRARTHFGASGPVRKRRTVGQVPVLIGGVAFAFVLIAGIILVLATASRISNRSDENQGTATQEESPSSSNFVPTTTETAGETSSDKALSGPQPPAEPVKRHLVFLFDDEEAAKEYWSWNGRFGFGADGAKAPKGPRSFLRSRHRYSGDVSIDIDFSFGRATYSNTGGAWVTVWNRQLDFYNQWRPINARLHIHREGDKIVFRRNGEEKRIAIDPAHASEESTMIEIRWRSRTSHFRRIEISAGSVTPAS